MEWCFHAFLLIPFSLVLVFLPRSFRKHRNLISLAVSLWLWLYVACCLWLGKENSITMVIPPLALEEAQRTVHVVYVHVVYVYVYVNVYVYFRDETITPITRYSLVIGVIDNR